MRAFLVLGLTAGILAGASPAGADADLERGKTAYTTYCAICHGPEGDGQGLVGKTLNPPPRDFTKAEFKFGGSDQDIFDVITNGGASKGGSPLMAPWGSVIPEADRWALVKFIRALKK